MAWSSTAWLLSVVAVAISGGVAAYEGHWRRRPGFDLGFVDHGGMWGDAWILPIANALIVPWVAPGWWLAWAGLVATAMSVGLHVWWHGGTRDGMRDHLWPSRPTGRWAADLSAAGWCHVGYVAGALTVLLAYLITPVPWPVVLTVTLLLSVHVPIGLLQPAWLVTGRVWSASLRLVLAALGTAWLVAAVKL